MVKYGRAVYTHPIDDREDALRKSALELALTFTARNDSASDKEVTKTAQAFLAFLKAKK